MGLPEKFFEQLPKVLSDATALPGEEAQYARILSAIAAAEKDPALKSAMADEAVRAERELIDPLLQFRNWGRRTRPERTGNQTGCLRQRAAISRSASAPTGQRWRPPTALGHRRRPNGQTDGRVINCVPFAEKFETQA
jgi:hypothetical protein